MINRAKLKYVTRKKLVLCKLKRRVKSSIIEWARQFDLINTLPLAKYVIYNLILRVGDKTKKTKI